MPGWGGGEALSPLADGSQLWIFQLSYRHVSSPPACLSLIYCPQDSLAMQLGSSGSSWLLSLGELPSALSLSPAPAQPLLTLPSPSELLLPALGREGTGAGRAGLCAPKSPELTQTQPGGSDSPD